MPNSHNCRKLLYRIIPPLQWLKEYDIKQNLLKDVVGGITVNFSKILFILLWGSELFFSECLSLKNFSKKNR